MRIFGSFYHQISALTEILVLEKKSTCLMIKKKKERKKNLLKKNLLCLMINRTDIFYTCSGSSVAQVPDSSQLFQLTHTATVVLLKGVLIVFNTGAFGSF